MMASGIAIALGKFPVEIPVEIDEICGYRWKSW
jgi:hypothetical protein